MATRFSGGIEGLLHALMWIQRENATGSLASAGGRAGRLVFRDALLLSAEAGGEARQEQAGTEDALREGAIAVMEDLSFGDKLLVFSEGKETDAVGAGAGRLNAADLILDLVRRVADPRWVGRRLGESSGGVSNPSTLPAVLPRVAMSPTEAFLLSRADGTMGVEQILQICPLEPADVKLALYGLVAAGLLAAPGISLPGWKGPEAEAGAPPAEAVPHATAGPADEGSPASSAGSPSRVAAPEEKAATPRPAAPPLSGPPPSRAAAGPEEVEASSAPPAPATEVARKAAPDPPGGSGGAGRSVMDLEAFLARTAAPAPEPELPAPAAAAGAGGSVEAEPAAGTGPPSAEIEEERARVLEWISSRTGADHYGLLEVSRTADEGSIRRAYYRIAKRFHPDRFRRPGFEELLQDVEKMFAAITEAYNTLTDDRLRAAYEQELSSRTGGARSAESDLARQARESYLRAKRHAEAEEYFDAAALLDAACRFDGSKAEYWLLLGTVQSKNPRWRRKAEESFKRVVEIDPTSADGYLHLARLYKSAGLTKRTQEMYRKVLEWDPQNEEAEAVLSGKGDGSEAGVGGRLRSIFKGSRS